MVNGLVEIALIFVDRHNLAFLMIACAVGVTGFASRNKHGLTSFCGSIFFTSGSIDTTS